MNYADRTALMKEAGAKIMVRLFHEWDMTDDCLLCYDSGGRKKYVVGRLDNGEVFAERCEFDPFPNGAPAVYSRKAEINDRRHTASNVSESCFL